MTQPPLHTIALIVAAGSGERFGGGLPKPYAMLGGKPVLRHTVEAFLTHPKVDGVRVVISRPYHLTYKKIVSDLTLFPPLMGGARRQDSVRLGLESLTHRRPTNVLIHDAARPLVSHALIDRVLAGLEDADAVLPAAPVSDTIRRRKPDGSLEMLDRASLIAAQTPQGFRYDKILTAHQKHRHQNATDDIALAEWDRLQVVIVDGDPANLKITYPSDIAAAESFLHHHNE